MDLEHKVNKLILSYSILEGFWQVWAPEVTLQTADQGLTNSSFNHLPDSLQHLENSLETIFLINSIHFLGKWNKKSFAQPRFGLGPGRWTMDLSGPGRCMVYMVSSATGSSFSGWKGQRLVLEGVGMKSCFWGCTAGFSYWVHWNFGFDAFTGRLYPQNTPQLT